MKPDLTKLADLNDSQLQQISADIKEVGVRQAATQASKQTERDIDKSTLQRFDERTLAKRFLVEGPETADAAREILRYAATGRPDFSDATLKVLEESAFKLSLVCTKTKEEMEALTQISNMLCRFRSTTVRERMAAVQERKAALREKEL